MSPHVDITWISGDKPNQDQCQALVDTGADWTLISESLLSHEELELLKDGDSEMRGQGVTGAPLDILGEVWRDFRIGDLVITNQRFVAVRGIVSDVILGMDFWGRVSPFELDPMAGTLRMCGGSFESKMHSRRPS